QNIEDYRDLARKEGLVPDERPMSPAEISDTLNNGERVSDEAAIRDAQRDRHDRGGKINDLPDLVEIKAPKGRDSYKNAREASDELTFTRRLAGAAWLMKEGVSPEAAHHIVTTDPEPTKLGLADEAGNVYPTLSDHYPIVDSGINAKHNWRG